MSDRRMDMFCKWFEHQLRGRSEHGGAVESYALSEQSRKIAGVKAIRPSELLALPALRSDIDACIEGVLRSANTSAQSEAERLGRRAFAELQGSVKGMRDICARSLTSIAQYRRGRLDRQALLNVLGVSDAELSSNAHRNIVGFLISDAIDSMNGQALAGSLNEALEQSEGMYSQLLASAEIHLRIFDKFRRKMGL